VRKGRRAPAAWQGSAGHLSAPSTTGGASTIYRASDELPRHPPLADQPKAAGKLADDLVFGVRDRRPLP
jgi:hypothetical protein